MSNLNGHKNRNIEGKRMIVKDYRGSNDVTIMWEEDNSCQKTTAWDFKHGTVVKNGVKITENILVGMSFTDASGESAVVVSCSEDGSTCTLKYTDGEILDKVPTSSLASSLFGRDAEIDFQKSGKGIDAERARTKDQVAYLLSRFHRCLVVRPCGFGKTKMALSLFKSPKYKKCLFLYPNKDARDFPVVKNSHLNKQVDIQTYQWLVSQNKKGKIAEMDYDIVFFDEAHFIGGDENGKGAFETYKAVMALVNSHPHTHFLGATATPFRMDGIDISSKVFLRHECYPYTELDAIEDGIIKKPYYYYNTYDIVKKIRDAINSGAKKHVSLSRDMVSSVTGFTEKDISEFDIEKMPENIRRACCAHIADTSYMQFIAFYLTHEELKQNKAKVTSWFKKAFPEHEVETITITSESTDDLKSLENMSRVPSSSKYKGKINLVFNCEILCRGYHSEDLTGVIMERKTRSFSKFMQMAGRLLSCDSNKPVLIFDIEDNIHSDFVFESLPVIAPAVSVPGQILKTEPKTFAEVERAYPDGIDWEKIDRCGQKARVSEKIAEEILERKTEVERPSSYISELFSGGSSQAISAIKKSAEEKRLTWAQVAELTQKIMDSECCREFSAAEAEPEVALSIVSAVTAPKIEELSEEEEAEIGYGVRSGRYRYNEKDRELYALFNVETKTEEDIVDIIRRKLAEKEEDDAKRAVEKFLSIPCPECKERYSDYSQVDKKSVKYQFLKSVAETVRVAPELVIKYMVEHA